jgi:hypothetical protein
MDILSVGIEEVEMKHDPWSQLHVIEELEGRTAADGGETVVPLLAAA